MSGGVDSKEQSEDRLDFVVTNIEDALRGEEILIPEDLLEFGTYLAAADKDLREKAISMYRERFRQPSRSRTGVLKRPICGDMAGPLLVFCLAHKTNGRMYLVL